MDPKYVDSEISRGKPTEDAAQRAAEGMAPGQGFYVVEAITQADQHQRDHRIAEEPERLKERTGYLDLSKIEKKPEKGCVNKRKAKDLPPVSFPA